MIAKIFANITAAVNLSLSLYVTTEEFLVVVSIVSLFCEPVCTSDVTKYYLLDIAQIWVQDA
jgi:hypothetical protein